jgi:hypothetical protein
MEWKGIQCMNILNRYSNNFKALERLRVNPVPDIQTNHHKKDN